MHDIEAGSHLPVLADLAQVSIDRVENALERGQLRRMSFRGYVYYVVRKKVGGLAESTVVVFKGGEHRVVPAYPSIQRVLLLEKALRRWFVDKVVVEEKMDGYNVRVAVFNGEVLAFTRGGYICPYTTARVDRLYGDRLRAVCREYDCARLTLAGEVVGLENPYTRFRYPEAADFGYFVFDVFVDGKLSSLKLRDELVGKYGLKRVPVLLEAAKGDVEAVRRAVSDLEAGGREGVVLKDPEHRVPALKYTTSSANLGDLRVGMKFFFEEGKSFLFSRILREIFKVHEERLSEAELKSRALELGLALLAPAVEAVELVEQGAPLREEFELKFPSEEVLREFMDYMRSLGIGIVVLSRKTENGWLRARMAKTKETWIEVKRILETGLSPLD